MNVHWFQHVEFEGLGRIEPWLRARGHELSLTRWWAGERVDAAALDACDWLIVMGGPMNVYQHRDYAWLPAEKAALAAALHAGKRVLGVCLGAQLIADVLGGKVMQNAEREIGWWPVRAVGASGRDEDGVSAPPFVFPPELTVLHWHGDTFTLPPGAVPLAESAACARQAFAWGPRVLALQFHLELDAAGAEALARSCADELLAGGIWVQTAERIAAEARVHEAGASALMERLLEALESS